MSQSTYVGAVGYQGYQGIRGNMGSQGWQGSGGYQGATGGPQGDRGYQGFQGFQGLRGPQGFQGNQGAGFQGYQGYQGRQGSLGLQGWQGWQGIQGHWGYQGTTGGPQGDRGYQGWQGFQGSSGGPQGPQGDSAGWVYDGTQAYRGNFNDRVGIGVQKTSSQIGLTLSSGYQLGWDNAGTVDTSIRRGASGVVQTDQALAATTYVQIGTGTARLRPCTIGSQGDITTASNGNDMMLNADNDTSPIGEFIAEKVWSAVYNDFADWQDLHTDEPLLYGKCYYDTIDGAKLCTSRCQKSVIGIASDTFGMSAGSVTGKKQIPISIMGWVLAHVDKEYEPGAALTNNENGILTEMSQEEKTLYPERILAIYKKKENKETWGTTRDVIQVNGRHWVKVK